MLLVYPTIIPLTFRSILNQLRNFEEIILLYAHLQPKKKEIQMFIHLTFKMIVFSVLFAMYIFILLLLIFISAKENIYICNIRWSWYNTKYKSNTKEEQIIDFFVKVTIRKNLSNYFFFSIMVLQNVFGTSLILTRRNKIHLANYNLKKKKSSYF